MRIINITIEIEDNDLIEQQLFTTLDGILGNKMRFSVIPDTTELYNNDDNFRKLCTKLKECQMIHYKYIKRNN